MFILIKMIYIAVLCFIAICDAGTRRIPDRLNAALALLGVADIWVNPEIAVISRLAGALVVSAPMLIITLLLPGSFGGGDIKMMAATGIFLGWRDQLVAAFLGMTLAGVYATTLLLRRRANRKDTFALGPFLCIGIAIVLIWGEKWFR